MTPAQYQDAERKQRAAATLAAARIKGDLQVRLFNARFMLDHRTMLPWTVEIDEATAGVLRAEADLALFTGNDDQLAAAADAIGKALRGAA